MYTSDTDWRVFAFSAPIFRSENARSLRHVVLFGSLCRSSAKALMDSPQATALSSNRFIRCRTTAMRDRMAARSRRHQLEGNGLAGVTHTVRRSYGMRREHLPVRQSAETCRRARFARPRSRVPVAVPPQLMQWGQPQAPRCSYRMQGWRQQSVAQPNVLDALVRRSDRGVDDGHVLDERHPHRDSTRQSPHDVSSRRRHVGKHDQLL